MSRKKSKFALPVVENKISEENAKKQVMLLLIRYNIDIEEKEGKEKKATEETVQRLLKDIMAGRIEIFEEEGKVKVKQFIQNRSAKAGKEGNRTELLFDQMTAADHEAMPEGDDVSNYTKMFDLMASMCETNMGDVIIRKLGGSDAKVLENVAVLFL